MVGSTYMGLPVTRWGRLRELVEALLLTLLPPTLASRLQSVKIVSTYCSLISTARCSSVPSCLRYTIHPIHPIHPTTCSFECFKLFRRGEASLDQTRPDQTRPDIDFLTKYQNFDQNSEFCANFRILR